MALLDGAKLGVLRLEAVNVLEGDGWALINVMNCKWSLLGETTLAVLNSRLVDNFSQLREERNGGWSGGLEERMERLLHLGKDHLRGARPGGHHLE